MLQHHNNYYENEIVLLSVYIYFKLFKANGGEKGKEKEVKKIKENELKEVFLC